MALSHQDGTFDGKQPEKGNMSGCLSPVVCGSEVWSAQSSPGIDSQLKTWRASRGLQRAFPFPRNKVSQKSDWLPENSTGLFLSGSLEKGREPCMAGDQGPIPLFLCSPRTSLPWHSPARCPRFNLRSRTSKLLPTLAPGRHL